MTTSHTAAMTPSATPQAMISPRCGRRAASCAERSGDGDDERDPPLVADDEIPPEAPEPGEAHTITLLRRPAQGADAELRAGEPRQQDQRQSDVTARPLDGMTVLGDGVQALDEPEHAERRQQEPDAVLDQVLGHARERAMDGDSDREHERERRLHPPTAGAPVGRARSEAHDDEHDLEPFEQHALERDREGVPVETQAEVAGGVVRGFRLRHEGLVLVVQSEAAAAAQNRLAQPLQPEGQEQDADDELQPVPSSVLRDPRADGGDERR